MSRVAALAFSVVLTWPAADVLVAAWAHARAAASADYGSHALTLYGANLTAVAFHEPAKLRDSASSLESQRPAWETAVKSSASGSWDDFAAFAATMGAR